MNWIHSQAGSLGYRYLYWQLEWRLSKNCGMCQVWLNWEGKGSTYHGACVGIHTRANPMYETNTSWDHINPMDQQVKKKLEGKEICLHFSKTRPCNDSFGNFVIHLKWRSSIHKKREKMVIIRRKIQPNLAIINQI